MELKNNTSLIIKGVIAFAILIGILIINPFVIINAGEAGVLFSRLSGVQKEPLGEGIHFIMPFVYTVVDYDVRTMKFEAESECSTADLQDIRVKLAINYKIDQKEVANLHQTIGADYIHKVIVPAMEEAVKASTALFKIEEVITKRSELRDNAFRLLEKKMTKYFIILQDVSVMNISFSEAYSKSVEEKQIQEQRIKTKQYERMQADEEAKKTRVLADARAYEQTKLRMSVSQDVVRLEWIKKWDGKLPNYMSDSSNSNIIMPVK